MTHTAVDFLINELNRVQELYYGQSITPIEVVIKAQEMFEQQIIDAFNGEPHCDGDGDRYYNETFKQQENETDSI